MLAYALQALLRLLLEQLHVWLAQMLHLQCWCSSITH